MTRTDEVFGTHRIRTYVKDDPRIEIDPKFGALHEVGGRLTRGPPKTPASVRAVHLPPFLAALLAEHRERNPNARFVFAGARGASHRRSNFRRRVLLPALAGDEERRWSPLNQEMRFHDLHHIQEA